MKVKKFNIISEDISDDEWFKKYKIEIDNRFYYAIGTARYSYDIYDAYGNFLEEKQFLDDDTSKENFNRIYDDDLPKEVIDTMHKRGKELLSNFVGDLKQKGFKNTKIISNDDISSTEERGYSDMSKNQLNDLINQSIDSGDFKTAQEISKYIKESLKLNNKDMKVKKFNQLNEDISKKEADELGITKKDLEGGITNDEYDEIINFIMELKGASDTGVITDEEKVLSEILLQIVNHPFDRNLDYETSYHRRLGFIRNNKDKKIEEGISRTYSEFYEDVYNDLINRGLDDMQAGEYMDYYDGKGYLHDSWENGMSPKETINHLKVDGKIKWYK